MYTDNFIKSRNFIFQFSNKLMFQQEAAKSIVHPLGALPILGGNSFLDVCRNLATFVICVKGAVWVKKAETGFLRNHINLGGN